jgi:hypothetical protein
VGARVRAEGTARRRSADGALWSVSPRDSRGLDPVRRPPSGRRNRHFRSALIWRTAPTPPPSRAQASAREKTRPRRTPRGAIRVPPSSAPCGSALSAGAENARLPVARGHPSTRRRGRPEAPGQHQKVRPDACSLVACICVRRRLRRPTPVCHTQWSELQSTTLACHTQRSELQSTRFLEESRLWTERGSVVRIGWWLVFLLGGVLLGVGGLTVLTGTIQFLMVCLGVLLSPWRSIDGQEGSTTSESGRSHPAAGDPKAQTRQAQTRGSSK